MANMNGVTGLVMASPPPPVIVGSLSWLMIGRMASASPVVVGPTTTCALSFSAARRTNCAVLVELPSVSYTVSFTGLPPIDLFGRLSIDMRSPFSVGPP